MFTLVLRIDLTKIQTKLIMPQFTVDQRTFLIENCFKTQSINKVIRLFEGRFPDRNPPSASTVWRNVNKYRQYGTSVNRNRENSGRKRTGRSEENIQAVIGNEAGFSMNGDVNSHNVR